MPTKKDSNLCETIDEEVYSLCKDILERVSCFKDATGVSRVSIETEDGEPTMEFNRSTGKVVESGNRLRVNVFVDVHGDGDVKMVTL